MSVKSELPELPLRPTSGYLVVAKDALPGTVGEIVLPEQNSLRPTSGVVVCCSDDLTAFYPRGTQVIFGPHAGAEFKVKQGKFLVLRVEEIQATIESEPAP